MLTRKIHTDIVLWKFSLRCASLQQPWCERKRPVLCLILVCFIDNIYCRHNKVHCHFSHSPTMPRFNGWGWRRGGLERRGWIHRRRSGQVIWPQKNNNVLKWTIFNVYSNASVGETSLDRLACSLGGKSVLQPVLRMVQPMMHHGNGILSLADYLNELIFVFR